MSQGAKSVLQGTQGAPPLIFRHRFTSETLPHTSAKNGIGRGAPGPGRVVEAKQPCRFLPGSEDVKVNVSVYKGGKDILYTEFGIIHQKLMDNSLLKIVVVHITFEF